MTSDVTMDNERVFVTRYALTLGIFPARVVHRAPGIIYVISDELTKLANESEERSHIGYLIEGDYCSNFEKAAKKAEQMRLEAIKSAENELSRLKEMVFTKGIVEIRFFITDENKDIVTEGVERFGALTWNKMSRHERREMAFTVLQVDGIGMKQDIGWEVKDSS